MSQNHEKSSKRDEKVAKILWIQHAALTYEVSSKRRNVHESHP